MWDNNNVMGSGAELLYTTEAKLGSNQITLVQKDVRNADNKIAKWHMSAPISDHFKCN